MTPIHAILALGPTPGGAEGQGSPMGFIPMLVIMAALFYFMLIRPQQRREKERKKLIESVKTGDRVLFAGGILGQVSNVKEKRVILKIADNVKVEVLRSCVTSILNKDEEEKAE